MTIIIWPFRQKKKGLTEEALEKSPQETDEPISEENSTIRAYVVTDTLDLHGFFPQQIPQMIRDFIDNARRLKLRKLRVVHGKGKSRLKWEVLQALKANPHVESFGDAPPESGGWGATVVVIKEKKDQP